MAVIDKTKAGQTKSDTAEKETKNDKGTPVDLLQQKDLPTGEKRKHDSTEDAWAYSAPPKAGRYSIKLHPAKDPAMMYDKDRQGNQISPIYSVSIEGEIVNSKDGEFDKVRVFPRVSTAVGRGKNISTAAGLLVKLGYGSKLDNEIEDKSVAVLALKAIMKEPVTDVEIDWQAYSKEDERVVYRGMHKFPQDENGEPMHIVEYKTKAGIIEEIRATLEVTHWYGKGETESVTPKGQAAATKGSTQTLTLAKDDEEETKSVVTTPKANAAVASAPAPAAPSIEDELAELEDL